MISGSWGRWCSATRCFCVAHCIFFWLAAAGPAVNFMLAGIWALRLEQELTIRGSAFWAANLLTGGFNLLPVPPLDGAQLASCLCEMRRAGKKFKGND